MNVKWKEEAYPTPTPLSGRLSSYLGWSISKCCFTSCSTAALQGTTAAYIILSTASNMSYKDTHTLTMKTPWTYVSCKLMTLPNLQQQRSYIYCVVLWEYHLWLHKYTFLLILTHEEQFHYLEKLRKIFSLLKVKSYSSIPFYSL